MRRSWTSAAENRQTDIPDSVRRQIERDAERNKAYGDVMGERQREVLAKTRPATVKDIADWIETFLEKGNRNFHHRDVNLRDVDRTRVLEHPAHIPDLRGVFALQLIVAEGVLVTHGDLGHGDLMMPGGEYRGSHAITLDNAVLEELKLRGHSFTVETGRALCTDKQLVSPKPYVDRLEARIKAGGLIERYDDRNTGDDGVTLPSSPVVLYRDIKEALEGRGYAFRSTANGKLAATCPPARPARICALQPS
jgi:hypothetical protein